MSNELDNAHPENELLADLLGKFNHWQDLEAACQRDLREKVHNFRLFKQHLVSTY